MRKGFCFSKGGQVTSTIDYVQRGTVRNPDRRSLTQPGKTHSAMMASMREGRARTGGPPRSPMPPTMKRGGKC